MTFRARFAARWLGGRCLARNTETDMPPDRNAMTIGVGAMGAGECRMLFRRGVSDNIGQVGCGEGSWCDRGARRDG